MTRTTPAPHRAAARVWPLLLGLLATAGCHRPAGDSPAPGRPAAHAPPVTTARPARRTLVRRIEQPGEIEAFARTPIHAKVSGYVARVYKDIGDPVKAGDLLLELAVP